MVVFIYYRPQQFVLSSVTVTSNSINMKFMLIPNNSMFQAQVRPGNVSESQWGAQLWMAHSGWGHLLVLCSVVGSAKWCMTQWPGVGYVASIILHPVSSLELPFPYDMFALGVGGAVGIA